MKAVRLITSNIKGLNLDTELSGRDIFVGANGSGKSAHLEGFVIGYLGYVPGQGRELSDTFRISSADEMSSTLEIDSGFKCTRTIKEKKTKHQGGDRSFSLSMTASVFPPRGEKTDNERKTRIATELGDFSVMFDLASLFAMSDNEKRKFIFSLTDPAQFGWTREKFLEEVTTANEKFGPYLKNLSLIWRNDVSIQENVSNCLAWVKEQVSVNKAQLKKALAAKEQLLQQKREVGSDPGSASELGSEYQKARADLTTLTSEIATAQEKLKTARMLRAEVEQLNKSLVTPDPKTFSSEEIAQQRNFVSLAQADITQFKGDIQKWRVKIEELTVKHETFSAPYHEAATKLREVNVSISKVVGSKGICPLIGKKCKADLQAYAIELGVQRDESQRKMNEAGEARNKLQTQISELQGKISSAETSLNMRQEAVTTGSKTVADMEKQNAIADKDRETRGSWKSSVEQKTRQLNDLQLVDVNALEAAKNGLVNRIQTLEKEIEKRKTIANLLQSFDRANIEATEVEQTVDVLDDLAKFLGPVNLQGRILKDTIGPLISKVNSLLSMTGRSYNLRPIMQDKNDKEIFDFAWQKDGRDVNFESLSGGERVVFGAALACALVLQKNPPLKALVIEAAEADAGNLTALMEALNKFGGDLGNVLIATHIGAPKVTGWTVHSL